MKINFPRKLSLEQQIIFERDNIVNCWERFYELAKSRVTFVSEEENKKLLKRFTGRDFASRPWFYVYGDLTETGARRVKYLEIFVDKNFFQRNSQNFSDLIPYAIEHEIYEAWLVFANEDNLKHRTHLLARRREVRLAINDDKIKRLALFYSLLQPKYLAEVKKAYCELKNEVRA